MEQVEDDSSAPTLDDYTLDSAFYNTARGVERAFNCGDFSHAHSLMLTLAQFIVFCKEHDAKNVNLMIDTYNKYRSYFEENVIRPGRIVMCSSEHHR